MSQYLLTCRCGKNVPVEVGQAGGQVICSCGERLDVPTLRKLRHLPVADATVSAPPSSTWGARQGIMTVGIILAVVLAGIALWLRVSEPTVPVFDPAARGQSVDAALETMTPVQAWDLWINIYRPMSEKGFARIEDPRKPIIEQFIAKQRFRQKTLLIVAACCAIVAVAAALWPRPPARLAATR